MVGPFKARKVAERSRRELDIAAAVGRERLAETHVAQALELVERARADDVPPTRALSIYARLHRLGTSEALLIGGRVLARLGEQTAHAASELAAGVGAAGETAWDSPDSLLGQIRKRLRGRVNGELRGWVELHTGRTEVALLSVHVENALRFIEVLKAEASIAHAVEAYVEVLGVRRSVAEVVYFFALQHLSDREAAASARSVPRQESSPGLPVGEPALRIIKDGG